MSVSGVVFLNPVPAKLAPRKRNCACAEFVLRLKSPICDDAFPNPCAHITSLSLPMEFSSTLKRLRRWAGVSPHLTSLIPSWHMDTSINDMPFNNCLSLRMSIVEPYSRVNGKHTCFEAKLSISGQSHNPVTEILQQKSLIHLLRDSCETHARLLQLVAMQHTTAI